jgi:hypothetical protein
MRCPDERYAAAQACSPGLIETAWYGVAAGALFVAVAAGLDLAGSDLKSPRNHPLALLSPIVPRWLFIE